MWTTWNPIGIDGVIFFQMRMGIEKNVKLWKMEIISPDIGAKGISGN